MLFSLFDGRFDKIIILIIVIVLVVLAIIFLLLNSVKSLNKKLIKKIIYSYIDDNKIAWQLSYLINDCLLYWHHWHDSEYTPAMTIPRLIRKHVYTLNSLQCKPWQYDKYPRWIILDCKDWNRYIHAITEQFWMRLGSNNERIHINFPKIEYIRYLQLNNCTIQSRWWMQDIGSVHIMNCSTVDKKGFERLFKNKNYSLGEDWITII